MARVVLENVRVDFPIYGTQQRSLRTAIFQRATGGLIHREGRNNERIVVRALSDVSLRLEEGDRLGLIGHNGSGKSTLLKVIAGIYEPIAGTRRVEGLVTPLFDMMPGLDLEDNGYENMLTSGMLLGMSRDQVESRIPEIEEFWNLTFDLGAGHAEKHPRSKDVLIPRVLRIETGHHVEQWGDTAFHHASADDRLVNARDDLQEGGLPEPLWPKGRADRPPRIGMDTSLSARTTTRRCGGPRDGSCHQSHAERSRSQAALLRAVDREIHANVFENHTRHTVLSSE